jgi:hypothetical protein
MNKSFERPDPDHSKVLRIRRLSALHLLDESPPVDHPGYDRLLDALALRDFENLPPRFDEDFGK